MHTFVVQCVLGLVICSKSGADVREEPEFKECVNSSVTFTETLSSKNPARSYLKRRIFRQDGKRTTPKLVHEWTVYKKGGRPFTIDIQTLCKYGHNFLRAKHTDTPLLVYNSKLAESAEEYAEYLASTGEFEHDPLNMIYGENLYSLDNTYDYVATPISALMAWYQQSWVTLNNVREDFNYTWNPETVSEFSDKGVGHFTQVVWNSSLLLGCGAATTQYTDADGRTWTRTIHVTRYSPHGNVLGSFPEHVHPLIKGGTLEGLKRGKLYPNKGNCVDTVHPDTCSDWKQYGWCDRKWAQRDCYCTCVIKNQ